MSYTAAAAGVAAGAAGNRIWRNAGLRAGARRKRHGYADGSNVMGCFHVILLEVMLVGIDFVSIQEADKKSINVFQVAVVQ